MRIYLDFDGVLHPTGRDSLPFEHLPAFEGILRRYPHAEVVITSSWREVFSLEHIRAMFFSEDVQHQIVGATPLLPNARRFDEVQAHLRATGYQGEFVVIDDDASQFPVGWPPLLLCLSNQGLVPLELAELQRRLKR